MACSTFDRLIRYFATRFLTESRLKSGRLRFNSRVGSREFWQVTFDACRFVRFGLVPTGHRFGALMGRVMKMAHSDSSHRQGRCDESGGMRSGSVNLEHQSCGRRGEPQLSSNASQRSLKGRYMIQSIGLSGLEISGGVSSPVTFSIGIGCVELSALNSNIATSKLKHRITGQIPRLRVGLPVRSSKPRFLFSSFVAAKNHCCSCFRSKAFPCRNV